MSLMNRRQFVCCAVSCSVVAAESSSVLAQPGLGLWEGGKQLPNFPLYTQPDGISCGPTCCSMLLNWYGIKAGIGPCKTKAGTRWLEAGDIKVGMTLPVGIVNCLSGYGVPARVVRGSLQQITEYINQDRPPILLVRSGSDTWHYVVAVGYMHGTAKIKLADPAGEFKWLESNKLEGAWTYSHDMQGNKIDGRRCRTCGGNGKIAKGWTTCAICSGSGKVKIVVDTPFGKVEKGLGKCNTCGGKGKWESGGANCPLCGGDGRETDWFRKAVETAGVSGHTMIVPDRKRPGGNGGGGGGSGPTTVTIKYTIWNDTRETVKFRLPSGETYTLRPGQRGSYHNTGQPANLKIHVFNSNRDYTLTAGDHRFWWMTRENRIGLDLNYKK